MEVSAPTRPPPPPPRLRPDADEQARVTRQTLQTVLQQALELLKNVEENPDAIPIADADADASQGGGTAVSVSQEEPCSDHNADELCELIKSKIDSPTFFEKFGSVHMSASHDISDIMASWDVVSSADLWQDKRADGKDESDHDDYVLVSQEDIADGIASFMAAYLLSLKQTKEISPDQIQKALSKTFSVKKKKSKLRKAWDGSKVIYNVASWGATAIGLYQNPVVFKAASVALWSSCRVISKLF